MERARQEREDAERERADRGRMEREAKQAALAPITSMIFENSLGEAFGGCERGTKMAELIAKLRADMAAPLTGGKSEDEAWNELEASAVPMGGGGVRIRGNPTKSNRIKPKNVAGGSNAPGIPHPPSVLAPAPLLLQPEEPPAG